MLCCFVVLAMTTVWVAPSSFRIILGERAEHRMEEEKRHVERRSGGQRGVEETNWKVDAIGGSRRAEQIIREQDYMGVCLKLHIKLVKPHLVIAFVLHDIIFMKSKPNNNCFDSYDNMRTTAVWVTEWCYESFRPQWPSERLPASLTAHF